MKLKHEELLELVKEPVSQWNKNTWPKKGPGVA
jgi:hypothetical protein